MRITKEPVFSPITIVIETEEEARILAQEIDNCLAAIHQVSSLSQEGVRDRYAKLGYIAEILEEQLPERLKTF